MKDGFTLIELVMVFALVVILFLSTAFIFRAVLLSWGSQETRTGIGINLDRGLEEIVRDLREAKEVQSTSDEIRFRQGQDVFYIYYLYNANDSYPLTFSQNTYQLKKESLSAGINGTFSFGSGQTIATDVLAPPASDLSLNGSIITLDISLKRGAETIRSRTQLKPRNL
jgi:prepilin-type N-terminal cleavage/methylation domain-containing protein